MPRYKVYNDVNAMQFDGHNFSDVLAFVGDASKFNFVHPTRAQQGEVAEVYSRELFAWQPLRLYDWVVETKAGHFIAVKNEEFEEKYVLND